VATRPKQLQRQQRLELRCAAVCGAVGSFRLAATAAALESLQQLWYSCRLQQQLLLCWQLCYQLGWLVQLAVVEVCAAATARLCCAVRLVRSSQQRYHATFVVA
jgi:hypothetical protein